MPMHDWANARPGRFAHFHTVWMTHLAEALNARRLPGSYFALAEQKAQPFGPDVITLSSDFGPSEPGGGGIATLTEPRTERQVILGTDQKPGRRLAIRHATGDRLVAVVEIVSARNKDRPEAVGEFVGKVAEFLMSGVHVVVVDVFPPGKHDPGGLHPVVCERLDPAAHGDPAPAERPLTFAGYRADLPPIGYLNYAAVGQPLPTVPLFLDHGLHVDLPLEETYMVGFDGLPGIVKREMA